MFIPVLFAQSTWAAELPPRAEVVADLLAADPDLEAARRGVEAAAARAAGPATLAPVMLQAGVAPFAHHELGVEAELGWTLPAPAMWAARARLARAGLDEAHADAAMREVEAAASASQLYDRAWLALRAAAIGQRHLGALQRFYAATERRAAAGLATADSMLMMQMELVEDEEARLMTAGRLRVAAVELRRLGAGDAAARLAGALDEAVRVVLAGSAEALGPSPAEDPGPVLASTPAATPPAVAMARAELQMAEGMQRMTAAEARPMGELMASYSTMWGDPDMAFMAGLGVELPLDLRRARAEREAARAERAEAEQEVAAAEARARAEEAAAAAMVAEAEAMERLMVERMLPLAEARHRVTCAAFEQGVGPLEPCLEAEKQRTRSQVRVAEARAERRSAEAMVAMARGLRAGLEVR